MAVKTAEKLLQEVRPRSPATELKVQVLECYVLLNTRAKASVDKALEKLMVLVSNNVRLQWNLRIKDTLGPAILLLVERLSSSQSERVSFVEIVPFSEGPLSEGPLDSIGKMKS